MSTAADFKKESIIRSLIERCESPLRKSLSVMLPPSDVEDVMQEAWLKVFIALKNTRIENVDDYCFRVARNAAIDRIRANARDNRLESDAAGFSVVGNPTQESETEYKLFNEVLTKLIEQLPAKMRNVFIARQIKGMSHREIAENFQISVKTVESHLLVAMKTIRIELLKKGYTKKSSLLSFEEPA